MKDSFATNASPVPPRWVRSKALAVVGKSVEDVYPVTEAVPLLSTAMARASS